MKGFLFLVILGFFAYAVFVPPGPVTDTTAPKVVVIYSDGVSVSAVTETPPVAQDEVVVVAPVGPAAPGADVVLAEAEPVEQIEEATEEPQETLPDIPEGVPTEEPVEVALPVEEEAVAEEVVSQEVIPEVESEEDILPVSIGEAATSDLEAVAATSGEEVLP